MMIQYTKEAESAIASCMAVTIAWPVLALVAIDGDPMDLLIWASLYLTIPAWAIVRGKTCQAVRV